MGSVHVPKGKRVQPYFDTRFLLAVFLKWEKIRYQIFRKYINVRDKDTVIVNKFFFLRKYILSNIYYRYACSLF